MREKTERSGSGRSIANRCCTFAVKGFLPEKWEQASSVFRDSNGDVWWGCATGIWRQRDMEFKYFPMPIGAKPPEWIYEIIPGRGDGWLWVRLGDFGTVHFRQGVWKLNDRPRGVPVSGPSASYQDPSGRVWLGFSTGQIYVIDGDQVV